MAKILIVEDDRTFVAQYQVLLKDLAVQIDSVPSGGAAIRMVETENYDLVLSELSLADMSGLDLLARVKAICGADVIIITGDSNIDAAISALKNGARDYLIKPFDADEFRHSVALTIEQRRVLDENQELKSLVKLFQTTQTITNCLDLDRLPSMVMDAFVREIHCEKAVGYFKDEDGKLDLYELRGVSMDEGKRLGALVPKDLDGDVTHKTVAITESPFPDVQGALVVPVMVQGELYGVLAFFHGDNSQPSYDRRLNFLREQTVLAFDNAIRFTNVRNLLNIDELTGLFNYRYLDVAIEREIRRVERYGSNVSVLFLDLDNFKNVNDTHGHLVGSKVLQEVGGLLKNSVRDVDIVIRYGGDEFTVILSELGTRGAAIVAERIRRAVEDHHFLWDEGFDIRLTACLGYASFPEDCKSKVQMLDMADKAMYRGKAGGKNMIFHAANLERE